MNWIGRLHKYYKCLLMLIPIALVIFVSYFVVKYEIRQWELYYNEQVAIVYSTIDDLKGLRTIDYIESSPNQQYKIRSYEINYSPYLHESYYGDYFPNQQSITLYDVGLDREYHIFTDYRIGDPHWLGINHIFFTSYCGTSCQGMYLVDTRDKETRLGVLSYMFDDKDNWHTYFRDWFGREHTWDGLVDEILSETINGKPYLIFKMENNDSNALGERRLLFIDDELVLVN